MSMLKVELLRLVARNRPAKPTHMIFADWDRNVNINTFIYNQYKGERQTLKAITLSITTRGIGLGICHLAHISISYHTYIQVPNIYALYKVSLGLVEAKLESIKKDMPVVPWGQPFRTLLQLPSQ